MIQSVMTIAAERAFESRDSAANPMINRMTSQIEKTSIDERNANASGCVFGFTRNPRFERTGFCKSIIETFWTYGDKKPDTSCDPKAVPKYIELPFTWVDIYNNHSSDEDLRFEKSKTVIKDAAIFTGFS